MKQLLVCIVSALLLVACQTTDDSPEPNGDMGDNGEMSDAEDSTKDEMEQSEDGPDDSEGNAMGEYELLSDAELEEQVKGELDGAENIYMMQMGQTVYVAADIQDETFDVDAKEQAVSQVVKETIPDVETVRLTTNPDFLDLADRYREDFDAGKPVEGFFKETGEMIDRIFPDREE